MSLCDFTITYTMPTMRPHATIKLTVMHGTRNIARRMRGFFGRGADENDADDGGGTLSGGGTVPPL